MMYLGQRQKHICSLLDQSQKRHMIHMVMLICYHNFRES